MKVTNWRKKIAASLVAGGLLIPSSSFAANLDTNLVVDPGFEDINSTTSAYDNRQLNSWSDGTTSGYTYATGVYDQGGPLSGGGARYFTSNGGSDPAGPSQVAQRIDVSTGATGAQIASGAAAVSFSSFMTSFEGSDIATLDIEFLDGTDTSLGSLQVSDTDNSTWTLNSGSGVIPLGTETLVVSVFGEAIAGGPDGYQDNVDVQVTNAASIVMYLEVNTITGVSTLKNETGEVINIDYYEITSAGNSLDITNGTGWNSLQDQNLAGFPAGSGIGNGWEEADSSGSGVLSESYLTGNSAVADQAAVNLGALFDSGDPQDFVFKYGIVEGSTSLAADFDNDNDVDGNDFLEWQRNSPTLDAGDLANWESEYGSTGGPSGPSTLVTGFVRYVTSSTLSIVPEPGSIVLVGIGLVAFLAGRKRE